MTFPPFFMAESSCHLPGRCVVKIGSRLLIDPGTHRVAQNWLNSLAQDIMTFRKQGMDIILVSSGAVALGRHIFQHKPTQIEEKQAAAAVGQAALMRAYEKAFAPRPVAQALLTFEDTENRHRWLNARATLTTLLEYGVCPVVNENDTVATEEIRYGDNDRLAARVAQMMGADLLVLLSDVEGLYTEDPYHNPEAQHYARVEEITEEIEALAGGPGKEGGVGTGGMRSKLEAAKIAGFAGCWTVVTRGSVTQPLTALLKEQARATWFQPRTGIRKARSLWIAGKLNVKGELHIDEGAKQALYRGGSLLPVGVCDVRGNFMRGDAVDICDIKGRVFARGLSGYDAEGARSLLGIKSSQRQDCPLTQRMASLVHRDDLILLKQI